MKKLTALILTVLMILASLPMMAFAGRFDDVSNEKWYSEGISFCAANGYMTGTSETVFDRNAELSRSMFVTILAKVDGVELSPYENKTYFKDVKRTGWYTSAIGWASLNGLASGIGDGVFGYKNPVTREQMALFLYAYAEKVNEDYLAQVLPGGDPDAAPDPEYTPEERYNAIRNMIAINPDHRDIGDLQSETQEMVKLEDGQYYQTYVSRTHDMRYIFISSAEYEMDAEWDWLPIGTREEYALENLGKIEEDQSGLEGIELPIDTTLRADLSVFKDADRVHDWARDAMEWAVACELFSGIGEDLLDPRGNCTRAQAAVLIRAFVLNFLCDCEHEWVMPTCLEGGYCTKCELRYGYELGHDIPEHLCTNEQKCTRCEYLEPAKEHKLTTATCTKPSVCTVCSYEAAPANGHRFKNDTPNCIYPRQCMDCDLITDKATGHSYIEPTCTANGYCTKCGFVKPALGHDAENSYCTRCGLGIFEDIFHYLSYHADYNLTKKFIHTNSWSDYGKILPCSVQYLKEGEERAWYMKDKEYDNVVYFCYGSYKNGRRIEVGIQIAPTEAALLKGEYTYYAYSYGQGIGFTDIGTIKASEMTTWMDPISATVTFSDLYVGGLNEDPEQAKARLNAESEKLITDYLKKALSYAKYRLADKGMEVNIDDFGFINY